jgi:hypothetical protein
MAKGHDDMHKTAAPKYSETLCHSRSRIEHVFQDCIALDGGDGIVGKRKSMDVRSYANAGIGEKVEVQEGRSHTPSGTAHE